MKRVYLAGSIARREEIKRYQEELRNEGFYITSRWLDDSFPHYSEGQMPHNVAAGCATRDMQDVLSADLVIVFSNGVSAPGGGRHVELGIALAARKTVLLVGPLEHVFHAYPGIVNFSSWYDCLTYIRETREDYPW